MQEFGASEKFRVHIGIFGARNAGKSSLFNALSAQKAALVSDTPGTTTDPVKKTMEILPLGPVTLIDTPGIDDEGELGRERVRRSEEMQKRCDAAVLCLSGKKEAGAAEERLFRALAAQGIPLLAVITKAETLTAAERSAAEIYVSGLLRRCGTEVKKIYFCSAVSGEGIEELKTAIGELPRRAEKKQLLMDLVAPGDTVVLVCPQDESAPRGRLILPQQMAVRELLDGGAFPFLCQPEGLPALLSALREPPALIITDSQAFAEVAALIPDTQPLSSFSMLLARQSGVLEEALVGAEAIRRLEDGAAVLISEGCTHKRQCKDIGTVKLPKLLEKASGKKLRFYFSSGHEFPDDLCEKNISLVVHCGACMLGDTELLSRFRESRNAKIPITNYGVALAAMQGILPRAAVPLLKEKRIGQDKAGSSR